MTHHTIALKKEHLRGSFNKDRQPIVTIESGDTFSVTTPDIEWGYSPNKGEPRKIYEPAQKEANPIHPMIGPIAISGAKTGMVVEIKIKRISPGWYGRNWAGGGSNYQNEAVGISQEPKLTVDWLIEDGFVKTTLSNKPFALHARPFLGLIGLAPGVDGTHITSPPRRTGGNIDCRELIESSSLFLPVEVDGAHVYVGDGHALQADGETSGTAIECPTNTTLEVTLHTGTLQAPMAKTPTEMLFFGFDEDLNLATQQALGSAVTYLEEEYQITRTEAMALSSTVVDLRITQIVNGVKGVHAAIQHDAIKKTFLE
ncbi:acetamidase/formamidase family protein [Paenalkalicoccus suaedae]|uniref:Acetamidase/formamidase family protein n=1 Tax=Paenalkalicoccus suaedae TaxID=2592382 RepID=A0A859FHB9_9BACI|nr:acetamidase/formamidase family protein [Paenalkalicoccus suaedae]QKS71605.1 acetamidase/formamidase family protein [Paenalkalicoccus suaedae]